MTDMHPKASQKLLDEFFDADLAYHLNGTPHHISLDRAARRHLGQTRRMLTQVAGLGPDAKKWMDHFIEGMNDAG